MPDAVSTWLGIATLALATYLTRIAGYFLGGRIRRESLVGRVLEALPGAALAGVLALTLSGAAPADLVAVLLAVAVYLRFGRTLPAIVAGLVLAVSAAHLAPIL